MHGNENKCNNSANNKIECLSECEDEHNNIASR